MQTLKQTSQYPNFTSSPSNNLNRNAVNEINSRAKSATSSRVQNALDLKEATSEAAKIVSNNRKNVINSHNAGASYRDGCVLVGGTVGMFTGFALLLPAGVAPCLFGSAGGAALGMMAGDCVGTEIAKKYSRYAAKKHNLDLNEVVSGEVNDQSKLSEKAIVINNWLGSSFREYKKSKNKNNNQEKDNVMKGLNTIKDFVASGSASAADKKAILNKIHLIQKGTLFSGFNSGGYSAMKKNDSDMYKLIRHIKDTLK
jgi:hypothetical protein